MKNVDNKRIHKRKMLFKDRGRDWQNLGNLTARIQEHNISFDISILLEKLICLTDSKKREKKRVDFLRLKIISTNIPQLFEFNKKKWHHGF